jgi:DNA-binding NarL/FixJ family response regulator
LTTRVLVVDDHQPWRLSVRAILKSNPSLLVIAEARDGVEAVEKAVTLRPDLVLLDIGMPRLNGIEAAKKIRRACPESRIIFVTQENDSDIQRAALETGASAYLLKSQAFKLLPTIEMAMRTTVHSSPESQQAESVPVFGKLPLAPVS